jgi:CBS domain containing-hemolysin-like protein
MPDIWITGLLMVVCLIAEGFFSGSELGVVSADRMKLRHDAAKGSRGARLALDMLEKRPEWLLSTTLVGTNIAVVANSTIATALMISLFGEAGSWLAVILVAPLIWVFGEIVPKSVFQQRADTITPYVIYILRFFSILFWPILIILRDPVEVSFPPRRQPRRAQPLHLARADPEHGADAAAGRRRHPGDREDDDPAHVQFLGDHGVQGHGAIDRRQRHREGQHGR